MGVVSFPDPRLHCIDNPAVHGLNKRVDRRTMKAFVLPRIAS